MEDLNRSESHNTMSAGYEFTSAPLVYKNKKIKRSMVELPHQSVQHNKMSIAGLKVFGNNHHLKPPRRKLGNNNSQSNVKLFVTDPYLLDTTSIPLLPERKFSHHFMPTSQDLANLEPIQAPHLPAPVENQDLPEFRPPVYSLLDSNLNQPMTPQHK